MELVFSGGIANTLMASCLSYVVLFLSFTTSLSAPQNTAPPTAMRSSLVRIEDSTDRMALLSFKSSVSDDPFGVLASWNESLHFCRWRGVICGGTRHPERVTALDLQSLGLGGSISPSLANLTFLRRLNLANNQFSGHIPEELGHLRRLRYLNLSFASLVGVIPTTLSHCSLLQVISLGGNKLRGGIPEGLRQCSKLKILSLWGNMLVGDIPHPFANLSSLIHLDLSNNSLTGAITHSLGDLSALTYVDLSSNRLTGGIPLSFGNLSSLVHLDLSQNDLVGGIPTSLGSLSLLTLFDLSNNHFVGSIPSSLGSLSSLTKLYLSDNNLTGAIPSSLWNLSSLIHLAIQDNELSGTLPSNMCENLHALDRLIMYNNHFHGPIPLSLSNATTLLLIDLSLNDFTGIFPQHLGNLQNLVTIILADNRLEAGDWSFLKSLTNCSRLRGLQIDRNVLGGTLPSFVTNLSTTLTWLSMGGNQISGGIPGDIERLVRLTLLDLGPNLLTGAIPPSIGRLKSLNILDLNTNQLSKEIPPILGNLTQLDQLYLGFNAFSGSIPVSLGNCQYLEYLSLDYNNLSGTIPKEVVGITSLSILLGLSHNLLTGSLPLEVGSLNNLAVFDVSENRLSGGIPNTLGDCHILEYLVMKGNFFNGSIPSSLQNLKGLQLLDLSHNNLTGHIPEFLASFQFLQQLNLSFNNFEGEVPKDGIFGNVSAVSVLGNDELCGGNPKLNLPPCSLQTHRKRHWPTRVIVIISVSSALFCAIFLIYFFVSCYWPQSSRIKSIAMRFMKEKHIRVSYGELLRATNGFSSANVIGVGSFGSVYRGTMDCEGEKIVAVKVLNLQQRGASRSFTAECEALRNIRHRNLVKILTSCSSVDYQGNEFKALVFEFIPNESLDKWLHPEANEQSESRNLSLVNRLNIAIDVASALDYLHHQGRVPIVHCDLKPSNILLDDSMTAYVGDFGLARFLTGTISNSSCDSTSTIGLKGSVGYVAPEYGMANKVSTQGDVYSYGILLLEMFTGRRPTDELFKEGLSLHKYVELAFGERIEDVMDPHLFLREQDGETSKNIREKAEECVRSVLRMGLLCSKESPLDRMTMADVTKKLHAIKGAIP